MDETKNEALCKVCGDKASGKHYGVASCDGCRGFFKRSIRRNLEYICKETGRCIVDVTRRNQCQACRFRKCLQVNMKRDAVQHERAPRTTHPSLHHHHHYPMGLVPRYRHLQPSSVFHGFHFPSLMDQPIGPINHTMFYPQLLSGQYNNNNNNSCKPTAGLIYPGLDKPNLSVNLKDDEVSSSEEVATTTAEPIVASPLRLELPIANDVEQKSSVPQSVMSVFAENTYESAAKLLFLAIKWAKTIPSFLRLSTRDQAILLEESWSDLFVLTAAQWSLPIDEVILVNNAVAPSCTHATLEEDARKLREVILRLNMLRVDHTEHACLKALVLFKAECRGLCEPTHIELLQDQTHVMLHEYCSERQSHQKARFGKLLLTLPAIQSISRKSLEELLFKQTVGDVGIDKLLGDLAKVTYN